MQLFKARQRAQEEVDEALDNFGLTMEQVRECIGRHPRRSHSLYRSPHSAGCTTADLVHDVARRMGRRSLQPAAAVAN